MRSRLTDVEVRAVMDSGLEPKSLDEAAVIAGDLRRELEDEELRQALAAGDPDAWRRVRSPFR